MKVAASNKALPKKATAVKKERENNSPLKGRPVTADDYFGQTPVRRSKKSVQKQVFVILFFYFPIEDINMISIYFEV